MKPIHVYETQSNSEKACCQSCQEGNFLKHSETFPTCEILLALNLEKRILDPACSVGKLPDGVDVFNAGLVGAVGHPAAEGAHLGADHPEAASSASHVEEILGFLLMKIDRSVKEGVHAFVEAHASLLGGVRETCGLDAKGCTTFVMIS